MPLVLARPTCMRLWSLSSQSNEFEKTRVQWSKARTRYSPFTVDSAVLSQVLLDALRGGEFEKTRV